MEEDGRPAKKAKHGEQGPGSSVATPGVISADSDSPQSMADLDWPTLLKAHSTVADLLEANKVCAPQVTKKTIWWRLYHTWNMDDFASEVEQPLAYCNLCGKIVKLSKVDRSPTPLKRHLQIQHKDIFKIMNQQKLKDGPVLSPPGTCAKTYYTSKTKGKKEVNRSSQLKAITQWILETDQPLDVVEDDSFRKMTAAFVSSPRHVSVFTKDAVEQYISYLVFAMRHKLKEMLANQSLIHVHEIWTAYNLCSYQVDRVHWIDDDFKLHNCVIACDFDKTVAQGEPADALWESVGVARDKQVRGTVSNCQDSETYDGAGGPLLFQGVDFELNRIAEVVYVALGPNTKDLVSKARKLVEAVCSSAATSEFLLKAQQELRTFFPAGQSQLPLLLDSLPNSWWSTNEMLGRLLYLRKALEFLALDSRLEDVEILSKQDWDVLEKLHEAWQPFSIASQLLQKQRFVTIGLVPLILQVVGEDLNPDAYQGKLKTCMKKMLSTWEERFGKEFPSDPFHGLPQIVWIAHALDPRFKSLSLLESTTASRDVVFDAVLEQMILLKMEETELQATDAAANEGEDPAEKTRTKKQKTAAPSSELRALASSRVPGTKRGHNRLFSERLSPAAAPKSNKRPSATDPETLKAKEECQVELTAYKAAEGMKMYTEHEDGTKDFEDPLPWWKERHEEFPTVWKLARTYLPIPATCASSERAFDAEASAEMAKRCQAQVSSTQDMKLLKENAGLVEAFEEQQDTTDGGVTKDESKEKDDGEETEDKRDGYEPINKVEV